MRERSSTSSARTRRPTSRPCHASTRRFTRPRLAVLRTALRRNPHCSAGRSIRAQERAPLSALTRAQYALADRLVLSKIRQVFGPQHQVAMVGAAPVARELLEFFEACGVRVLEGYGMTESTAAATLNTLAATRFGTVGKP